MALENIPLLTKRELEVLHAYDLQLPCKQLADHLGMSVETLYTHQRNIISKLEVSSIAHAVALMKSDWRR